MSQNLLPSTNSSVGKNLALFNDEIIRSIAETVKSTLMKNASTWMKKGYINLDDFIQNANLHILNKSDAFDPKHGTSFKAWACVVARNYSISESKKLKRIVASKTSIDQLDNGDYSDTSIKEPFQKKEERQESRSRLKQLLLFLDGLNESEKLLLEMMKDGLSKEEMMEITHKSGGNIDTSKSRLRRKIQLFVKSLYE